jgi:hypothetical protein
VGAVRHPTAVPEEYGPDEQDELIGDATALGGPGFVEGLHYAATRPLMLQTSAPWDGRGLEPAGAPASLACGATQLVAERRARVLSGSDSAAGDARDG